MIPDGALMSTLERRCLALLRAYPADYRRSRGTEILDTMLSSTPPGRAWPTPGDAADVVIAGLRQRFDSALVPEARRGLHIAGAIGLAVAGGVGSCLLVAEPLTDAGFARAPIGPFPGIGSFVTLGPIAYAAWIVAALVYASGGAAWRWAVGLAAAATLAIVPAAAISGLDHPGLRVLTPVLMLLLLVLAAPRHGPGRRERIAVGAGMIAAAGLATAVIGSWWSGRFLYASGEATFGLGVVLLAAFAGTVVAGLAPGLNVTGDARIRWAALALLPPTGCAAVPALSMNSPEPLLVLCVGAVLAVAATVAAAARRKPAPANAARRMATVDRLGPVGNLAIGYAVALCAFLLVAGELTGPDGTGGWGREAAFGPFVTLGPLAYAAWFVAAAGWATLPARYARALVIVATLGTLALIPLDQGTGYAAPPEDVIVTLVVLGLIALTAGPRRAGFAWRAVLVPVGFLVPIFLAYRWLDERQQSFPSRYVVAVYLAAVPLAAAMVIAWTVLRAADADAGTGRARWIRPAVMLLAATGGLGGILLLHGPSGPGIIPGALAPLALVGIAALATGVLPAAANPSSAGDRA